MQDAAERKAECEKIKQFLQSEESKIQGARMEVEEKLQEVEPMIQAAKKSVDGINKSDLDFLRNLKMPPITIHHIMKAVLRVFDNQDDRWQNITKFLGNRTVLD